jgi:hypothetical protein
MRTIVWVYLGFLSMAVGAVVFGERDRYDFWFLGLMVPIAIAGIGYGYYERRDARKAARLPLEERDRWLASLNEQRRHRAMRFLKEYVS